MKNKKSYKKKVQKSETSCCQTENGCWKSPGVTNFELEVKRLTDNQEYIKRLEQENADKDAKLKLGAAERKKLLRLQEVREENLDKSREKIQNMLHDLKIHPDNSVPEKLIGRIKNETENYETDDFVKEIIKLHSKNENLSMAAKKFNDMLEDSVSEVMQLKNKLDEANIERYKLHDSWKFKVGELLIENIDTVNQLEAKIKMLERQNEGYKASAKQASEVLEQQHREFAKISALEFELKLKNDLNRDFKAKIRMLDNEFKESKMDECPICFEATSIERKWTAFLPCGRRTCSECADKISDLPRSTNRRKCLNCRENINCFLVLEGIYEG